MGRLPCSTDCGRCSPDGTVRLFAAALAGRAADLAAPALARPRQPEYLHNLGERYGFYRQSAGKLPIWVHAVSVGETRAAQPLIEALRARWPDRRILLTGMTPTGREAGRQVYGEDVVQAYLPYDYPGAVDRFLRHFSPAFGVLMETEIWPNLLAAAARRNVPVLLANARLSVRSARGYGRVGALARPAFAALRAVAAQTAEDAGRLRELGATNVTVCGNLKFDVALSPQQVALGNAWRREVGARPVWLAASTRDGEELLIIAAWRRLARPDALLVLVPRHPQRFAEVAELLAARGSDGRQAQRRIAGRRYPGLARRQHGRDGRLVCARRRRVHRR